MRMSAIAPAPSPVSITDAVISVQSIALRGPSLQNAKPAPGRTGGTLTNRPIRRRRKIDLERILVEVFELRGCAHRWGRSSCSWAPSAISPVAGSPWPPIVHRLPPSVPRLRSRGQEMSVGDFRQQRRRTRIVGEHSISWCVTSDPMLKLAGGGDFDVSQATDAADVDQNGRREASRWLISEPTTTPPATIDAVVWRAAEHVDRPLDRGCAHEIGSAQASFHSCPGRARRSAKVVSPPSACD